MNEFLRKIATSIGISERSIKFMGKTANRSKISSEITKIANLIHSEEGDWEEIIFGMSKEVARENGVYTPLQYLIYLELVRLKSKGCSDYPFLHNLMSITIRDILEDSPKVDRLKVMLQNVFLLRERREEGQRLSFEIVLPFEDDKKRPFSIDMKGFSQVFGRGIAYTQDKSISLSIEPKLRPNFVFENHNDAPLSSIYDLREPYPHLQSDQMSIVLRNDGHVAISEVGNPLVEFYDGGWHICDLKSIKKMLASLTDKFDSVVVREGFVDKLIYLAYHMGSHWHGGLIAIVNRESLNIFMKPKEENNDIRLAVEKELGSQNGATWTIQGKGRLLLTTLIHDGATVFSPDGNLLGTGMIVKLGGGNQISGGSRRQAAKRIAESGGIAIYISQDGAIKIFDKGVSDPEGVRVH